MSSCLPSSRKTVSPCGGFAPVVGSFTGWRWLTRVGWGYNVVSQMGFNQPKICEKETIYVNLVLQCKAKTKHRPKTLLSPLKSGFVWFYRFIVGKVGLGKNWRKITKWGRGGQANADDWWWVWEVFLSYICKKWKRSLNWASLKWYGSVALAQPLRTGAPVKILNVSRWELFLVGFIM